MPNLLSNGKSNAKLSKEGEAFESVILYLTPSDGITERLGKKANVCPWATDGCRKACLYHAGRGKQNSVIEGRAWKTMLFFQDRPQFMDRLRNELSNLIKRADSKGLQAVARLDGTSDLGLAERIAPHMRDVLFYDYTASKARVLKWLESRARGESENYHLTFSRKSSAQWDAECKDVLRAGGNVSVVFTPDVFEMVMADGFYQGWPVVDGTAHDWRFKDEPGHVVALSAKGSNKSISDGLSDGFIVDVM